MCRVPVHLRESVKQRLAAAAEEIFELLERTIAEYEEESERQRTLLEHLLLETRGQTRGLTRGQTRGLDQTWRQSRTDCDAATVEPKEEQETPLCSDLKANEQLEVLTWTWTETRTGTEACTETRTGSQTQPQASEEEGPVSVKVEETQPNDQIHDLLHNQIHNQTQKRLRRGETSQSPFRIHSPQNSRRQSHKHRDPKVLSCFVCGKRFQKKGPLDRHLRVHTGERPFGCTVCAKRFKQKSHLQNHMLVHTRERPFSCSVCGGGFSSNQSLKRHLSSAHENRDPTGSGALIYCSID